MTKETDVSTRDTDRTVRPLPRLQRYHFSAEEWRNVGNPTGQERALLDVLREWRSATEVRLVISRVAYRFRIHPGDREVIPTTGSSDGDRES